MNTPDLRAEHAERRGLPRGSVAATNCVQRQLNFVKDDMISFRPLIKHHSRGES
jgi:hypothetical protein